MLKPEPREYGVKVAFMISHNFFSLDIIGVLKVQIHAIIEKKNINATSNGFGSIANQKSYLAKLTSTKEFQFEDLR